MTTYLLHIFIVTADEPQKCIPALESIWPDMTPSTRVTLLSGTNANANDADTVLRQRFPGLALHRHPGDSVWHLRQRMRDLIQNSRWMLLLEDHNLPLPGWLYGLQHELQHAKEGVSAFFGCTDNLTSTAPWDWANYLAVQVFHWVPGIPNATHPLPFNAAMRVSQLPPAPWQLGTFEALAVGQVAQHARSSTAFVVDHIQPRHFPSVLNYHFANGQATGAHIRARGEQPIRQICGHSVHVLLVRPLQSAQVILKHPQRRLLPRGTWWRLPLLLWAHALGAWLGFVVGAGRSVWLLE